MLRSKRKQLPDEAIPLDLKLRIELGKLWHHGSSTGGRNSQVHRLPFGRIAKLHCTQNELAAMELVAADTTVSIPRLYEIYEYPGGVHLVMEEVAGGSVFDCYAGMTSDRFKSFGRDLADCLTQLRNIPVPTPLVIGSIAKGPNIEHRLGGKPWGPFASVADFHHFVRVNRSLKQWANEPDLVRIHEVSEKYGIKFSHAELNPNNIMVWKGCITAVIDWEFAGWYPEYWDYTKLYWCPRPVWQKFYDAIKGEPGIVRYPDELAAEQAIWKHLDPWSYED